MRAGVPIGPFVDAFGTDVTGLVQIMPTNATITSVSGRFTSSNAIPATFVAVTVQLWTSSDGGSIFIPVAGASCDITLVGIILPGEFGSCRTSGLSIPVAAGTPAFVIVSARATGGSLVNTINGWMSSSVTTS
jgi:hypothetical protein